MDTDDGSQYSRRPHKKKALVGSNDDSRWAVESVGPRGEVTVEQHEDSKFVAIKGSLESEGRRFRMDFFPIGTEPVRKGRFRVHYYLYNPFAIFDDRLTIWSKVREATQICVPEELAPKTIKCLYSPDDPPPTKTLEISFSVTSGGLLEQLILAFEEGDLDAVLEASDGIAGHILDYISLSKEIPIDVNTRETISIDTGKIVDRVLIFPFVRTIQLHEEDLGKATEVPRALVPLLRLLREARNSPNPYYQLLCLFRIYEGLKKKIRAANYKKIGKNPSYPKPKRRIPENEFTREYFSKWIGRPFEEFLDWVEHNHRDSVAHLVRKDPSANTPDPASTTHALITDRVNSMQISILRILILDEWEFMKQNGIE